MYLFLKCGRGEIPDCKISITGDTGWESDRTWSNGRKSSNQVYLDEVVAPLADKYGMKLHFIRAEKASGELLPDLYTHTLQCGQTGKFGAIKIPMFGSNGGRLGQSCTSRWKITAINQTLRRLGAKTAHTWQGIHLGEASRRVKGIYLRRENGFSIFQSTVKRKGVQVPIKWLTHGYPLVDLGLHRADCQKALVKEKIPYLLSSECDGCPHKDFPRWDRTSPEVIEKLAFMESQFNGEWFLTKQLVPIKQAIENMRKQNSDAGSLFETDFGCNDICGV